MTLLVSNSPYQRLKSKIVNNRIGLSIYAAILPKFVSNEMKRLYLGKPNWYLHYSRKVNHCFGRNQWIDTNEWAHLHFWIFDIGLWTLGRSNQRVNCKTVNCIYPILHRDVQVLLNVNERKSDWIAKFHRTIGNFEQRHLCNKGFVCNSIVSL